MRSKEESGVKQTVNILSKRSSLFAEERAIVRIVKKKILIHSRLLMQRQRFDRVRENDLKKKIFRNGEKSKLFFRRSCERNWIHFHFQLKTSVGIGWSEIKKKKKQEGRKRKEGNEWKKKRTEKDCRRKNIFISV